MKQVYDRLRGCRKKKGMGEISVLEGYMTVEASLVLPIVLGVIVFIIYFQLFWYDRCLMDQRTAMLGIRMTRLETARQEEVESYLGDFYFPEETVAWRESDLFISLSGNAWKLKNRGELLFDVDRNWSSEIAYVNRRLNPGTFLRLCRKLTA